MGDKSNGGTKLTLWIFAVVIFPTLFFIGTNVIANNKERIVEAREIYAEIKKEDGLLRQDFLIAFNSMRLEQKADMEKITEKIDKIKEDVTKIKVKVENAR